MAKMVLGESVFDPVTTALIYPNGKKYAGDRSDSYQSHFQGHLTEALSDGLDDAVYRCLPDRWHRG